MNEYIMIVQSSEGHVVRVVTTVNPFRTLTGLTEEAELNSMITVWAAGLKVYEVNV